MYTKNRFGKNIIIIVVIHAEMYSVNDHVFVKARFTRTADTRNGEGVR